MHVDLTLNNTN